MIILEDPYVSPELATFAADRQEPVLDTPAARQAGLDYGLHLDLVSSRDFGRLCCQGQRLYSNSENALDWLYSRSGNAGLVRATELLKNKLLFRQRLAPLFPDFHFRELTLRDVMETHFESLPGPCVLKPAVGFFSLGVYSIENAQQWRAARDDIAGARNIPPPCWTTRSGCWNPSSRARNMPWTSISTAAARPLSATSSSTTSPLPKT